jgi:predicted nuclease of predicted toxin-antitoxin system
VRIKLDEDLPARLMTILGALGHELDTVPREGLRGRDDTEVWRATQVAGRFFITQDPDFSDSRR